MTNKKIQSLRILTQLNDKEISFNFAKFKLMLYGYKLIKQGDYFAMYQRN